MALGVPPDSIGARLLARARFAVRRPRLERGDLVEFMVDVSYVKRTNERHLGYVPAGMRGVVRDIGPMPGCAGGAIVELLDGTGRASGYWTAAGLGELRRVA